MPKAKRVKTRKPTIGEVLQASITHLDLVLAAVIQVVGPEKVVKQIDATLAALKAKATKRG